MPEQMSGFPHWQVRFDENGREVEPEAARALIAELPAAGVTDLFVFSHGWNNDRATARGLYEGFFAEMRNLLDRTDLPGSRREGTIGTVGVIWPSMRWADEPGPAAASPSGGAAGVGGATEPPSDAELVTQLKTVFQ